MKLFRQLDEKEEKQFRQWARENYKPYTEIKGIWHSIVQEECVKINQESEEKMDTSKTVQANIDLLTAFNHSMAIALKRAKNGSEAENMYFLEKLTKTAKLLGYNLTRSQYSEHLDKHHKNRKVRN